MHRLPACRLVRGIEHDDTVQRGGADERNKSDHVGDRKRDVGEMA